MIGARHSLLGSLVRYAATFGALAACTSPNRPAPPVSPAPAPRDSTAPTPRGTRSRPSLTAGRWQYQITSDALVSLEGDSAAPGSPIHSVTRYTLLINGVGDTLALDGRVDSLSRTVGGRLPPPAADTVRPGFAAILTRLGVVLQLHDSVASSTCRTGVEPAVAAVQTLFITLPQELAPGAHWNDSVTTQSCRGAVPIATTYRRTFTVDGTDQWQGTAAWHTTVQAAIAIAGRATGRNGDSLAVTGSGESSGTLLLDAATGMILHGTTSGSSSVTLQTPRGAFRFREQSSETLERLPVAPPASR